MHLTGQRMVFVKSNSRYYKPSSLPAAGVGGNCNPGLLRYKKRRTSGAAPQPLTRARSEPPPSPESHTHTLLPSLEVQNLSIDGSLTLDGHLVHSSGDLTSQGTVSGRDFVVTSDRRLKTGVRPIPQDDAGTVIDGLRPTTYSYKTDQRPRVRSGFIAQEVRDVLPSAVVEASDGYLRMNTLEIVPYLVREIQTLKQQIRQLSHGKS